MPIESAAPPEQASKKEARDTITAGDGTARLHGYAATGSTVQSLRL